jgi:hypothetical protein
MTAKLLLLETVMAQLFYKTLIRTRRLKKPDNKQGEIFLVLSGRNSFLVMGIGYVPTMVFGANNYFYRNTLKSFA